MLRFSRRHVACRSCSPTRCGATFVPPQLRTDAGRKRPTRSGRGVAALRQAVMRANTEYVRADLIANAFMRLGDRESAMQWLVKGAASNVGGINFWLADS